MRTRPERILSQRYPIMILRLEKRLQLDSRNQLIEKNQAYSNMGKSLELHLSKTVHVGIRERYLRARVKVNRHIQIRCHFPKIVGPSRSICTPISQPNIISRGRGETYCQCRRIQTVDCLLIMRLKKVDCRLDHIKVQKAYPSSLTAHWSFRAASVALCIERAAKPPNRSVLLAIVDTN